MKKIAKKIILIILLTLGILFIKINNVDAAEPKLYANTTNPSPGQTVTVTGTITAGSMNATLTNKRTGATKSIYDYIKNANSKNVTGTESFTFTAESGTYEFSLTGEYTEYDNDDVPISINKSITITVASAPSGGSSGGSTGSTSGGGAPSGGNSSGGSSNSGGGSSGSSASSNANLSNLGCNPNDFTGFKAGQTEYRTVVPNSVTSVSVYAEVAASGAKYSVSGPYNDLQVGTNAIVVTVTAPDGSTTKKYTMYVERQAGDEEVVPNVIEDENSEGDGENTEGDGENTENVATSLKTLKIEGENGFVLEPEFDPTIHKYTISLKEDLDKIPLIVEANNENAKIEITGNENLQEGDNTITITITDEETGEKSEYIIMVNKNLGATEEENQDEEENNEDENMVNILGLNINKNWLIIGGIALVVLLIGIGYVIYIVIKRRNEDQDDYEFGDYSAGENYYQENDDTENNNEQNEEEQEDEEEPKRKGLFGRRNKKEDFEDEENYEKKTRNRFKDDDNNEIGNISRMYDSRKKPRGRHF